MKPWRVNDVTLARLGRRDWLRAALASPLVLGASRVGAAPDALGSVASGGAPDTTLQTLDLDLPGKVARRARLLVPAEPPQRLLILLHGLGEAGSESLALDAWPKLYGLTSAVQRLRNPPIEAVLPHPKLEDARRERINRELLARPFSGFAVVCPVTPNPAKYAARAALFDAYTQWLFDVLVPAVRARVPSLGDRVGLGGCSMGGYIAWEVLMRRPKAIATMGTVQAAIGVHRAAKYARSAAALPSLPRLHILTSSSDPFREANEQLSKELTRSGVAHDLDVPHGPHDQPWLRQIGTLEMLLWQDRML
jgi:pimeloyl-ACP methyl ester carboxylesterase